MGARVLFEKTLTSSDANGAGRIVIPKGHAESHFPTLPGDDQKGIVLPMFDTFGKRHNFRFRYWINNASRMYLLEDAQAVVDKYSMGHGDVLIFGRLQDGMYAVTGRRGSKADLNRHVE
ncbi:hypothetical protein H632_c2318p0, partial [Helicosporidium sp. ATCC 50920]